jgi:hypothetical protein
MAQANRNHKDSVFTRLFNAEAEALELYNAVGSQTYAPDTPVEIVTLEDVLFKEHKNDLAFIVDNRLIVLTGHQSSISPNYPLRCLMYIAREYEKVVDRKTTYKKPLVKIPAPEFLVLYNGVEDFPDEKVLRLSDAFADIEGEFTGKNALELTVRVININKGKNAELIAKSETLSGYVEFVARERYGETVQKLSRDKAVEEAVKSCISDGILVNFFESNGSEVVNMLDWNLDEAKEVWQEEAREEGLAQGAAKAQETILNLIRKGLKLDEIEQILSDQSSFRNLSVE